MPYQYRIEIAYATETVELIIHSDDTIEYIVGPLGNQTIQEAATIQTIEMGVLGWMQNANVSKIEISREEET